MYKKIFSFRTRSINYWPSCGVRTHQVRECQETAISQILRVPFFDAWKLSWGDIFSICALSLDLGRIIRSLLIFSTAYLNAISCLSSAGWNSPPGTDIDTLIFAAKKKSPTDPYSAGSWWKFLQWPPLRNQLLSMQHCHQSRLIWFVKVGSWSLCAKLPEPLAVNNPISSKLFGLPELLPSYTTAACFNHQTFGHQDLSLERD